MVSTKPTADSIFLAAVELRPDERPAYLTDSCGTDSDLRARVERLLAAQSHDDSFLESPATELGATVDLLVIERPGTIIGPYKLLEQIGHGGMGVVFMAEQSEPLQRMVALKIIKPGMDTRQVIARFEAERQAVAMMDHPNIAKVLDAGATESGRPYFVMELVKGVPITKYCDDKHLPLRARLEMFMQVCHAVQHAHQKGIIHRDIKPNNVLVAEYDDQPVPKVIDFGVAKATAHRLTERTMFTEFGQVLGTLEYMSPEQAKFNQLDIDTRSDIYSLGVLLYELLAGSTPFEGTRLKEAAFDEMLRIIREEEPPKPSTRVISSDTLPSIAANRRTEPARLGKEVRGDLDWIVMKALEKDRNRRYESANGFTTDVQNYLDDEPVIACSPSAAYRFRKFARRNTAALITAALVFVVLVLGTLISTWQALRATRAERSAAAEAQRAKTEAAAAQAVNAFLDQDLLAQSNPHTPYDRFNEPTSELKLLTVLDRAAARIDGRFPDQPLVEAALRETIGRTYGLLQQDKASAVQMQRAFDIRREVLGDEHPDTLTSMALLAWAKSDIDLTARVVELRGRVIGKNHPDTLESMTYLALASKTEGDSARAVALLREILKVQCSELGENEQRTAYSMFLLAVMPEAWEISEEDDRQREAWFRHALRIYRRVRDDSWHTYDITLRLGQFLSSRQRYDDAEVVFRDALTRLESMPGASRRSIAEIKRELTSLYRASGNEELATEWERRRLADAEANLARSTSALRDKFDDMSQLLSHASLLAELNRPGEAEAAVLLVLEQEPQHKELSDRLHRVAESYTRLNDWTRAERCLQRSLAIRRQFLGDDHVNVAETLCSIAFALREQGETVAAEPMQREALKIFRKQLGDDHSRTATVVHDLAFLIAPIPGRAAEAEQLYRDALAVRRRELGEGDSLTADTAFRLAQVIGQQGEFEEADTLLHQTHAALAANRESTAAKSFEPVLLQWIVEQYRGWGKAEEAAEWQRKRPATQSDR